MNLHFSAFENPIGVGNAVKSSGILRNGIFMTSKIGLHGYNETLTQMDSLLSDLQMNYVDLLLIHWPGNPPSSTTDPACQDIPQHGANAVNQFGKLWSHYSTRVKLLPLVCQI